MCKQTCLEKGLSTETSAIKIVNQIQANFNQFIFPQSNIFIDILFLEYLIEIALEQLGFWNLCWLWTWLELQSMISKFLSICIIAFDEVFCILLLWNVVFYVY